MTTGNTTLLNGISTGYRTRTHAPRWGDATLTGDGTTVAFNIAHGLAAVPTSKWIQPRSARRYGAKLTSATSTNLVVTFSSPPPNASVNVIRWGANAL